MHSFTAIITVLTSVLLASVQAAPQAAPQAASPATPKAASQAASQACWTCPSDQGLYKFQQQTGSDPLHCQFLKDGMAYYCDYKSADGTLIYNVDDVFCPATAVPC